MQSGKSVVTILLKMLHDQRAPMRLGAATCLAHLYNNAALPDDFDVVVTSEVLPSIIRLFDDHTLLSSMNTTVQERAINLFAYLVLDHADLQKNSLEADAITKLAKCLLEEGALKSDQEHLTESSSTSDVVINPGKLKESVLLAVAAVSSLTEECRRKVVDFKLLPCITACLENSSSFIRIAACKCAKSLSRSARSLRTNLTAAGITLPLFALLLDTNIDVQIAALAAIGNIVLDFSPMKTIAIEKGVLVQLVTLLQSPNQDLRLNATWTLKNMLYQADLDTKKSIILNLGWPNLNLILNDKEPAIQSQALNLFRNLACTKTQVFVRFMLGY